jgi:DNA-binding SARP family transcriptional activator
LRCQIAGGQRSAAIETYMACRHKLVEDLGIDPSEETRKLYDRVLAMEEPGAYRPRRRRKRAADEPDGAA